MGGEHKRRLMAKANGIACTAAKHSSKRDRTQCHENTRERKKGNTKLSARSGPGKFIAGESHAARVDTKTPKFSQVSNGGDAISLTSLTRSVRC
jgi:hypothetical protein